MCQSSFVSCMKILTGSGLFAGVLFSAGAGATDIRVTGLFPDKAVVQIDGGPLRTFSAGQKVTDDIELVGVDTDGATFNLAGRTLKLALERARTRVPVSTTALAQLTADAQGHVFANAHINGVPIRMMIDTGATVIVLPARDAQRIAL